MSIKDVLKQLVEVNGIDAAVCVGRDGFVIESASDSGSDVDAIGAMVSSGIGSAESVGIELNVGTLDQAMMEYNNGTIVMTGIGDDAILSIVAANDASLGNIRLQVRKRRVDLERLI